MASFLFILKLPVEEHKFPQRDTEPEGDKNNKSSAKNEEDKEKENDADNEDKSPDIKKKKESSKQTNNNEKETNNEDTCTSNKEIQNEKDTRNNVKNENKTVSDGDENETETKSPEWDFGDSDKKTDSIEIAKQDIPKRKSEESLKKFEVTKVTNVATEEKSLGKSNSNSHISEDESPKKFEVTKVSDAGMKENPLNKSDKDLNNGDDKTDTPGKKDPNAPKWDFGPVNTEPENADTTEKTESINSESPSKSEQSENENESALNKKKFDVEKVPEVIDTTRSEPVLDKDSLVLPTSPSSKTLPGSGELKENAEIVELAEEISKQVKFQTQVSIADEKDLQEFIEKTTILEDVEAILHSFDIENYTVTKTKNKEFYQVIFVEEGGHRCENILNALTGAGVGEKDGTSFGIYPSSIFRGKINESDSESDDEGYDPRTEYEGEFRRSIKARLLVSQVVHAVRGNAEFKFDFLMLVITASIIAALGLIESSSVILVASMLVSPLMGPILAGTFGFVIKNYSLRNLGIVSEIKGLLICVLNGFIVGLIASSISVHTGTLGGTESYPTDEMKSRGVLRGLVPGLLIAIASGVGVALSVLGGNAGSLVGVAISASLLPPAVNAGMLWAHSLVTVIKPQTKETVLTVDDYNLTTILPPTSSDNLTCIPFLDNTYVPVYSCKMYIECAYLGIVSLSLTILNIICIFIMGIIFLKIKEVAPQTSTSDATRDFWKDDIKIARQSYQTMKGPQSLSFGAEAKKFLQDQRAKLSKGEANTIDPAQIRELIEDVENDSGVQGIQQFIPGSNRSRPFSQQLGPEFNQTTFHPGSPFLRPTYTNTFHGHPTRPHSDWYHLPMKSGRGRFRSQKSNDSDKSDMDLIDETTPLSDDDKSLNLTGNDKKRLKFRKRSKSYAVEDHKSHPV